MYFLPISLLGQELPKKHSIYVQGGYMSSLYVKEAKGKRIISETETMHHKCVILNAGFQLLLTNKWLIGPAFTYDHFGTKQRAVEYSVLSYLLRCDRMWKETKIYRLYSGLAIGLRTVKRFEDEVITERRIIPGYHIYLIGADIKIKKFLFDVYAGYGVSGILNFGGKYEF